MSANSSFTPSAVLADVSTQARPCSSAYACAAAGGTSRAASASRLLPTSTMMHPGAACFCSSRTHDAAFCAKQRRAHEQHTETQQRDGRTRPGASSACETHRERLQVRDVVHDGCGRGSPAKMRRRVSVAACARPARERREGVPIIERG